MTEGLLKFLQSRNGMLAVLAIVATFALLLISWPVAAGFYESSAQIDELARQIAAYHSMSATIPALEAELRRERREAAQVRVFLVSENPELAAAQLEMAMKTIVQTNSGQIQSARILPASTEKGLDTVSVQYDLSVASDHFQNLVYAIETHIPYFFIDDVSIHGNGNVNPSSGATRSGSVEIEWTVHAFRLGNQK